MNAASGNQSLFFTGRLHSGRSWTSIVRGKHTIGLAGFMSKIFNE